MNKLNKKLTLINSSLLLTPIVILLLDSFITTQSDSIDQSLVGGSVVTVATVGFIVNVIASVIVKHWMRYVFWVVYLVVYIIEILIGVFFITSTGMGFLG